MTQRQAIRFTRLQLLEQFRASFPEMVHVAEDSDLTSFKSHIEALASVSGNSKASEAVLSLLHNDGKTIKELSTGEDIEMGIISHLYSFLRGNDDESGYGVDAFLDIYYQLCILDSGTAGTADENLVAQWMDRWPSGLEPAVLEIMERNRQRIMHHLVERVSSKSDRSVLNLPAIGKSMTFQLAGIMPDGRRVLCFDHDGTRRCIFLRTSPWLRICDSSI